MSVLCSGNGGYTLDVSNGMTLASRSTVQFVSGGLHKLGTNVSVAGNATLQFNASANIEATTILGLGTIQLAANCEVDATASISIGQLIMYAGAADSTVRAGTDITVNGVCALSGVSGSNRLVSSDGSLKCGSTLVARPLWPSAEHDMYLGVVTVSPFVAYYPRAERFFVTSTSPSDGMTLAGQMYIQSGGLSVTGILTVDGGGVTILTPGQGITANSLTVSEPATLTVSGNGALTFGATNVRYNLALNTTIGSISLGALEIKPGMILSVSTVSSSATATSVDAVWGELRLMSSSGSAQFSTTAAGLVRLAALSLRGGKVIIFGGSSLNVSGECNAMTYGGNEITVPGYVLTWLCAFGSSNLRAHLMD